MSSWKFSFCFFISYAYVCTCIRRHLKETIPSSSMTWSEMGKQNIQAKARWSGDVIRRTGMKNFNAVSHNRARPYFRIQHGRGEVRAHRVYLNVHSVTGNVVDTEWSVEFWRWKCCREFGNNTYGRARLWDTCCGCGIFLPTPPNYVTRSPGRGLLIDCSLFLKQTGFLFEDKNDAVEIPWRWSSHPE